jgi:hypothetical protein
MDLHNVLFCVYNILEMDYDSILEWAEVEEEKSNSRPETKILRSVILIPIAKLKKEV